MKYIKSPLLWLLLVLVSGGKVISQSEATKPRLTISPFFSGQLGLNSNGYGLGLAVRKGAHEGGLFHNMNDRTLRGVGTFYRFFPFPKGGRLSGFVEFYGLYQRLNNYLSVFPENYFGDFYNVGVGTGAEVVLFKELRMFFSAGPNLVWVDVEENPFSESSIARYLYTSIGIKYNIALGGDREKVSGYSWKHPRNPSRIFASYRIYSPLQRFQVMRSRNQIEHLFSIEYAPIPQLRISPTVQLGALALPGEAAENWGYQGWGLGAKLIGFEKEGWYSYLQVSYFQLRRGKYSLERERISYGAHFGKEIIEGLSVEAGGDMNALDDDYFTLTAGLVYALF